MPETTTPPKDPRLVAAEIALAEANARKAAAEASVAEVEALLPELPKEVTAGSLTPPASPPPIATVAAYHALGEVGREIAGKLPDSEPVWIVPDGTFQAAIDTHDALVEQLTRLTGLAQDAVPKLGSTPGAGFAPALGAQLAAAAVPLLMSLFSTSRTVVSAEVTVGFTSAAAAVAAASSGRQVYVLGVTPPPDTDTLAKQIKGLQDARDKLDEALVKARSEWTATSAEAVATAKAEAWKVALAEDAKRNLDRVEELVNKYADAVGLAAEERNKTAGQGHVMKSCEQLLQTIDEVLQRISGATGVATVSQCALGAALKAANVLVLQPTFTGAESIYEDVKLKRDRALHLGSSVVTWYLLKKGEKAPEPSAAGIEWAQASATTKVGLPEVTWAWEHKPDVQENGAP